ncbi:MAG: glutamate--cysteine ligase [Cyanobacteria bacterium J06621_3]
MNFKFGIEHEVAFLGPDGQFADFENTSFETFESIVQQLPTYEQDYPQLRIGDAGIKRKRWYVEGFERFDETGEVIDCPPKGIEIRTTVHNSIEGAVRELKESFRLPRAETERMGFTPALISFHPFKAQFIPVPALNTFEQARRQESPEMQTAHIPMLTQGPDINLSATGLTPNQLIDIGRKLTYYSPFIVPFSYSAPFYKGHIWSGLSARTFYRTGARPAAMVFLEHESDLIVSEPSLTQIARIPAEVGRIEFKAFDSCGDFDLYASLCALLKGLVMDETLPGRCTLPDTAWHQRSAQVGFADNEIYDQAQRVMTAARQALTLAEQLTVCSLLVPLENMLRQRTSPAQQMTAAYKRGVSIEQILIEGYKQEQTARGLRADVGAMTNL